MNSTLISLHDSMATRSAPAAADAEPRAARRPSFVWDTHFETGVQMIDEQHHALVDLINAFGDALLDDRGAPPVSDLLRDLERYAQFHFSEEEELMLASGIAPRHVTDHQKGHRDFIDEVRRMSSAVVEGHQAAESLLRFLTYWLAYHILGTDQLLARQIAAVRAGEVADRAYAEVAAPTPGPTQPLLQSLNGLFQLVSERNRELVEANRTLETKVAERTRALMEANIQLESIARTDVLTGLPNRRHALAQLFAAWSDTERQPLSCMMIDADGFKQINDRYGHDAGDSVLRAIATALRHAIRTDDIVARLGGDEFLIICPRTPLRGAVQLAELVRAEVAGVRVKVGDGGRWSGSVSIGVAERTDSIQSVDDLIKAADMAVYAAKRNGRDRVET
jgi:hemerythrin